MKPGVSSWGKKPSRGITSHEEHMLHDIPETVTKKSLPPSSLNYSPALWRRHPQEPDLLATGDSTSAAISRPVLAHQKQNPGNDEKSEHKSSYLESNRVFPPKGKTLVRLVQSKTDRSLPFPTRIILDPTQPRRTVSQQNNIRQTVIRTKSPALQE